MSSPAVHPIELCEVSGSSTGAGVRGISALFPAGRFHVLRGGPDCGKEALFRIAGLLEAPASGDVLIDGGSTAGLTEEARANLRTQRFGFVFSAPFLLGSFSVIENVAMPLFKISHVSPEEARRRTESLLEYVGLGAYTEAPVDELSTFAQYGIAIARGLVNEPAALMIENIDGALTGVELEQYLELLRGISAGLGPTIIATATPDLLTQAGDRVLDLAEGVIVRDSETLPEACE